MDTTASAPPLEAAPAAAPRRIYRHRLPVRLMHWINVVCLVVLLVQRPQHLQRPSGALLGPRLDAATPWLSMRGENTPAGPVGKTRIAGTDFDTTGVLGLSEVDGRPAARGLPELGDDPRPAVAGDGAPLAPVLRLAVRHQRRRLRALHDLQPAPDEGPGADPRRAERASAARSSTTSSSGIRPATPPRATTCCRASPT